MPQQLARLTAALAGRYRPERELASGGMATVYVAHDLRHDRPVALKVLHPELASSLGAERFLAEIRTTGRLHHPHILPLYDSGGAGGLLFYVMPLVEGESLRERLARDTQLPLDEALRLVGEVADALAYAHAHGVVHRDIKPANIMLASGHALVTDFGIASAATVHGSRHDTPGGVLFGTAAYMSPEQSAGDEELDARSDIYSLGCVLYEMLVGEPPFTGPTTRAIIARRLAKSAPSATHKRGSVPKHVSQAIKRAMAREPADRFQTASEFVEAISTKGIGSPGGEGVDRSIAVLPFANMSADADTEFFSDGIAEEILNALVRLPGLRVIARTSSFAFKGRNVDAREIGERLGVGMVLEGSVRRAGNRLRITAQLVDATGGHHLWSERYDRETKDIFAIQDEITVAIRDALSERLLAIGHVQPKARPAIDAETYELLLRGRFFIAKRAEGMRQGMEYLGQVVARAPAFAPAYAELATAYSLLTVYGAIRPRDGWARVRELAQAALATDPNLARAHAELGNVAFWFDWDWHAARRHFEHAVALGPNDPWVHTVLSHYWSSLGRHDEALRQGERAASLDPLDPSVRDSLAITHFVARNFERTIAVCEQILELDPTHSEAHRMKGQALRDLGRFDEAMAPTEAAVRLSGRHGWAVGDLGILHAAAGRADQARVVIDELVARMATEPIPPLAVASVHAYLHEDDAYFDWLGRAVENRDSWLVMMRVASTYDRGREDPRFEVMASRVGIPASP